MLVEQVVGEVGVHHVLLSHRQQEQLLLLVHRSLLLGVGTRGELSSQELLLLLLELLVETAPWITTKCVIEVQIVTRVLVSEQVLLQRALSRILQEVSLERVQILVEKLSVKCSLVCELLLVLQCQVVRVGRCI